MSGGWGCQTSRSPPCRPGRELELRVTWELPTVGKCRNQGWHNQPRSKSKPLERPNRKSVSSFPSSQIDAPAQERDFDEIATNIYIWHLTSELTRSGHCRWWWRGAPVWCRPSQKTSMDDQRHSKTIDSDHWPVVSYLSLSSSFLFVIASDFFGQAEAEEPAEEAGQGHCSAHLIWAAFFSGCRKIDEVGAPQEILCSRRRFPCRWCRLRRHWRRLVLAYTGSRALCRLSLATVRTC